MGFLIDVLVIVVGLTSINLLYALPALFVRRSLGIMLKAMMYLLFVIFLTWLQWEKFVGVQFLNGQVIAIRHWPRKPITVTSLWRETRNTGAVTSLTFLDGSAEGIRSVPVYHCDSQTMQQIHQLAQKLGVQER